MKTRSALATLAPVLLANGKARRRGLDALHQEPLADALGPELRDAITEAFQETISADDGVRTLLESSSSRVRAAGGILQWAQRSRNQAAETRVTPSSSSSPED